jgi:hypothetical protein
MQHMTGVTRRGAVRAAWGYVVAVAAFSLPPLTALTAPGARAAEVGGVRFPDSAVVGDQPLVLNGLGVRPKEANRVYAAALYTPAKTDSVNEVLNPKTPVRFVFVMLRDIKSEELSRMFSTGIEANIGKNALSPLVPSILRMSQLFSEYNQGLRAGESCQFDWVPGTGMEITINGKPAGPPFTEAAFFQAMMRIWLGDKPADAKLKDALLGKS